MKLTVSLDENLYKQAVEALDIADSAELLNQALEALLTAHGKDPIRTAALRVQEEAAKKLLNRPKTIQLTPNQLPRAWPPSFLESTSSTS